MKNFRGLKLLGLVTILAFALIFIVSIFVQGQVKIAKKPNKPPAQDEYVWSAVILDGPFSIQGKGSHTYSGDEEAGWLYEDSVTNINVSGSVKAVGRSKSPHLVRSYFLIEIFYPIEGETLHQIRFTENIINKIAPYKPCSACYEDRLHMNLQKINLYNEFFQDLYNIFHIRLFQRWIKRKRHCAFPYCLCDRKITLTVSESISVILQEMNRPIMHGYSYSSILKVP